MIACQDAPDVYLVPTELQAEGLDRMVCEKLGLPADGVDLGEWVDLTARIRQPKEEVEIGLVGKYVKLHDAYLSVHEALKHAGLHQGCSVRVRWVDAEGMTLEEAEEELEQVDGILVPGGFGSRGWEGKILACRVARERQIPYLGICLGMHVAVSEFARHVVGLEGANSTEMDPETPHPVIDLLPEQKEIEDLGGTMRLGAQAVELAEGTRAQETYGDAVIHERHRHRYEVNNQYRQRLVDAGLVVSGTFQEGRLVEIVELPRPSLVRCQPVPSGVQVAPDAPGTAFPRIRRRRARARAGAKPPRRRHRLAWIHRDACSRGVRLGRQDGTRWARSGRTPARDRRGPERTGRVEAPTGPEPGRGAAWRVQTHAPPAQIGGSRLSLHGMSEVVPLFTELAALPSPPGEEREVADRVADYMRDLALDVDEDDAGARVGSNAGNLYARVAPTSEGVPLFFCAHLDTVPPDGTIEPVVEDGIVRNAGGTILGADNKAAVAVMLEATRRVLAEGRPHAGIELLFTPKEEVGLLGRPHSTPTGWPPAWAMSTTRPRRSAKSSSARRTRTRCRSASTGVRPIRACIPRRAAPRSPPPRRPSPTSASAVSTRKRRRMSVSSTAAPRGTSSRSGARSSRRAVRKTREAGRPGAGDARGGHVRGRAGGVRGRDGDERSYRGYRFKQDDLAVRLAVDALRRAGASRHFALSGGAADANVFNDRGLQCVNLANGMANIHTPDEHIAVDDLEAMIDVTLALVDAARNAA